MTNATNRLIQSAADEYFPPVQRADADGLLAVGGALTSRRLIAAYARGLFPWYSPGEPVLWWSPDPRCVIFPQQFNPSRSLKKAARRAQFEFTLDADFARVMNECAAARPEGTWITAEMKRAYGNLHKLGVAHSVEVWQNKNLRGGLYGVSLGGVFFGESMFSRVTDASKVALMFLLDRLTQWDFRLLDCQVCSPHLTRLGATPIARAEFINRLQDGLQLPGRPGNWR